MWRVSAALAIAMIATVACAASPLNATSPSPSSDAAASPMPSDVPAAALSVPSETPAASESHAESPKPFTTPAPLFDDAPTVPVGRALNVQGEVPPPGMVRLSGQVLLGPKNPAPRICITLGPPIACAVLTDAQGRWVIDVPQGKITWELHFMRNREEVGPKVMIDGPFKASTVSVESVTVR